MNRKFISVLVVLLLIAVAALARHQQHNIKTNGNKVQLKTHRWYNPFAAPTTRDYLKDQDGNSIPLHNFMGTMYFADIKVGTPKQPFAVVLDTGSSTLWLPGIDCPIFGSNSCGFHPRYNRTQSSTYKIDPQGRKLHLEYGSGTSSGALVQEKLYFAGYETEVLMGEMDQVGLGAAYLIGKFDGLLGLGFMPLSPYDEIKMLPVMNLIEEGKLQQPYFQFYMSQEPDVDGEFVIGRIEPSHFENYDQVKWIPLQSKTYWDTKLVGISSNGKMLPLDVGRGVIDSGTSLIAASEAVLKVIAPIVGAKQFIIPQEYIFDDCSTTNKPDLTFHLGPNAEPFVLTPEMYIMRFSDDGLGAESLKTLRLQNRLHEVGAEEICLFSFLQMNMPPAMSDIVIIGDTFMKNYVVIHDPVEGKVGIGKAKL